MQIEVEGDGDTAPLVLFTRNGGKFFFPRGMQFGFMYFLSLIKLQILIKC